MPPDVRHRIQHVLLELGVVAVALGVLGISDNWATRFLKGHNHEADMRLEGVELACLSKASAASIRSR